MRKRRAPKRRIVRDPIYNDKTVSKFINIIMLDGKKAVAQKIVYDAFDIIEKKMKKPGIEVFKKAVTNASPLIEVRSRRVGGATYQVPMEVRPERRLALAFRWIKRYSRERSEKTMALRLANELMLAATGDGDGAAVKKRNETHRMAEANKAFAHFKW